jgi:hypothetical protein
MNLTDELHALLSELGLANRINPTNASIYFLGIYGLPNIEVYTPRWYRDNEKLQDTDEVYGFSTKVVMHMRYGIRCECHIHESYSGDQEYKLGKVFVINKQNEYFDLVGLDFNEENVLTEKGAIPFESIKLKIEDSD